MEPQQNAIELKEQGKSLRQIATELQVSKSTVQRWLAAKVDKSFLNPTWQTVSGGDNGPVDAFGAIPEPEFGALVASYEDTTYACSKWLSDNVSSVPLKVYVKNLAGQRQPKCLTGPVTKAAGLDHLANLNLKEVLDHPFKDLIDRPNDVMNRNEMLRIIDIDLSLTGNAFVYKRREDHTDREERDVNKGVIESLWPLASQNLNLAKSDQGSFIGFWDMRNFTPKFIPKEDIIWFKFVDPRNPYGLGFGPVRAVWERILLAKQELAYLSSLYRNQARPDSMVVIKDISPTEAERKQKEMNMRFKQGGMGGIYVTGGEMEINPLNWRPKDLIGTESYKYTKLQILNAFGLNPAIFDTESANRAVADTARYMAMLNGVLPRCRLIEEKLNDDLAPEFDERLMVVFDNPVPEDAAADLSEQTQLLDRDVIDVDEVRHDRGLTPRPKRVQAEAPITNDLRSTVGGLQAIASLQQQFYGGQIPREAAMANVRILFGFTDKEASDLFPQIKPKPLTQQPQQMPMEGNGPPTT